ncbi:hypothetical protein M8C21_011987, partial [Ambrosia artemisiifolia]
WEQLDTHNGGPGKRWGHTCNAVRGGQLLYIFGGYGEDNTQTNKVHLQELGVNLKCKGHCLCLEIATAAPRLVTATNTWMTPLVRGEGPEAREGHSAAVIGKRLFIFGGSGKSVDTLIEEYFDDLYILNTETMVWKRVATTGIPPSKRNSHTCVSWTNKIIVIGGEDTQNYYLSDVQMLDTDTLTWTKLVTNGEPLPPRAGHTTIALGKNLFVFGGLVIENERDERKLEKLSLRKKLRLKSQEQQNVNPVCDSPMSSMSMPTHTHTQFSPNGQNIYLNECHNANGKRTFQAKVTKSITNCYTIETVIDGKPLRGVLFSNNLGSKKPAADDLRRKRVVVDGGKKSFEHVMMDTTRSPEHQTPGANSAASDMKTPATSNVSPSHEVSGGRKSSLELNMTNTSTAAEDTANSIPNHDDQPQTEEHRPSSPLTQQVITRVAKESCSVNKHQSL